MAMMNGLEVCMKKLGLCMDMRLVITMGQRLVIGLGQDGNKSRFGHWAGAGDGHENGHEGIICVSKMQLKETQKKVYLKKVLAANMENRHIFCEIRF